jgi:segregation and condensation protein B
MRVQQVAGGYQLLTRAKLAPWLRRLAHVPGETRLSAPALETLAVIAYRQPVPRADIEAIRGVNCGEILRQLMERDLVRIGSRSEELGRPFLYATTKRFLELFGLNQIEELPRASELSQKNTLPPVTASAANQSGNSGPPIDEIGHESTFAD